MDPSKTDHSGGDKELEQFSRYMHSLLDECMNLEEASLVRVAARAVYSVGKIMQLVIQGRFYLEKDRATIADELNSPEHRDDLAAMAPEICIQIRKGNFASPDLGITKIEEIFDDSGRITAKGVEAIEALAMREMMKKRGGSNRDVG